MARTISSELAAWRAIHAAASGAFRRADPRAHRFARSKLEHDRVFRHVLEQGLIAPRAEVVDLGCGIGLLASLLVAADAVAERGGWPLTWPTAPRGVRLTGFDVSPRALGRARAALGDAATFAEADMAQAALPACDAAVFFDTLHYLPPADQDVALRNARQALRPGGTLLLRTHDAESPWRHAAGLWIDRLTAAWHGGGARAVSSRSVAGWTLALERLGFRVESRPVNGRPPFANRLFVARLPR